MRISKRPRKANRLLRAAFILLAALIGLTVWADYASRSAIESLAAHQAMVSAVRLVNDAMLTQMEREDLSYEKLVRITRGESGEVISIEADMAQINLLKTRMTASVVEKLEHEGVSEVSIPLGTIIGNQFTSARGPGVKIRLIPVGYAQSEIQNRFSSAGINQTLHQIMIAFTVQMTAVLPGYNIDTETVTNFCLAETVIVGQIPQGYASFAKDAALFAPVVAAGTR